jgi:hypothetical protein
MRRRSTKPGTPLNQKQEELALRESQLRGEMEKLERMIAEAPRVAEETSRRQREEILTRASEGGRRLDVSLGATDKWGNTGYARGPRVSLRKERREGRLVFLVLVVILTIAVLWLVSHLHF